MASIEEIASLLAQLTTSDIERRRELLVIVDSWKKAELPTGAARLLLNAATLAYPVLDAYPPTPNDALVRVLWSARTAISPDEIAAVYPSLNPECQLSALRLLAELKGRDASQVLAELLDRMTLDDAAPKVSWPVLLPLERAPRDPDLFLGPLLKLCSTQAGIDFASGTVLAYMTAGLLNQQQQQECVARFVTATTPLLTRIGEANLAAGGSVRWNDEHAGDVVNAGMFLDVLGRLNASGALSTLRSAASHPEPWIAMWGVVGLLRQEQDVSDDSIEDVAGDRACRRALAQQLEEVGKLDRFPAAYWNQRSLAESEMVDWLTYPTELGRAPDQVELIVVLPLNTDEGTADLYVFKFKTDPPHWAAADGWMVGIAGPYLTANQPSLAGLGATFSSFKGLESMSVEEHVQTLLEAVGGIAGSN